MTLPAAYAATVVVDDDGKATAGNCAAVTTTHDTIQEGVDAANPGDTVKVCPGTYPESVTVTKTLIIRGAKAGVDARTRSTTGESIVDPPGADQNGFTLAANNVVLDGFTVRGAVAGTPTTGGASGIETRPTSPTLPTATPASGYRILNNIVRDNTIGLYAHNAGANEMLVQRNLFDHNNVPGPSGGNGIYSDQGLKNALITANKFVHNANGALTLVGPACSPGAGVTEDVIIRTNRSINDNNFVGLFDVDGVQILRNRTFDTDNTDDFSSTVFVGAGADILVQGNVLRNPGFSGVAVRDFCAAGATQHVDILGNRVLGGEGSGVDVSSATPDVATVRNNTLKFNHIDGILFGSATNGNLIQGNTALDNVNFDCEDQSTGGTGTAGTDNTWVSNIGEDASPPAICDPPS